VAAAAGSAACADAGISRRILAPPATTPRRPCSVGSVIHVCREVAGFSVTCSYDPRKATY
jgi:hypothetical protein